MNRNNPFANITDTNPDLDRYPEEGALLSGRYRLLSIAGKGGMGLVYKAKDEHANDLSKGDEYLAIKVLSPLIRDDEEAVVALKREAEMAKKLRHHNLLGVYGFETDRKWTYLISEWIDGETLSKKLLNAIGEGKDGLAWTTVKQWLPDIAQALDAAHQQGVIHRDVKPGNIMVTPTGRVVLLDFGVSYQVGRTLSKFKNVETSSGTPEYIPPEAYLGGHKPLAKDDVYGLAVTIYKLLVNDEPYKELLITNRDETTPRPRKPSELTDNQWQCLMTALHHNPDKRPESAGAFVDTLLNDTKITKPKPNKPQKTVLAVTLAAVLGGSAIVASQHFLPPPKTVVADEPVKPSEQEKPTVVQSTIPKPTPEPSEDKPAQITEQEKQNEAKKLADEAKKTADDKAKREAEEKAKQDALAEELAKQQAELAEAKRQTELAKKQALLAEKKRQEDAEKAKKLAEEKAKREAENQKKTAEIEQIKAIQTSLNRLKCNAGKADGKWGRGSRAALQRLVNANSQLQRYGTQPSEALLQTIQNSSLQSCAKVATTTASNQNNANSQSGGKRIDHYIVYNNGTAKDTKTGLVWQRCTYGQTWNGSGCSGAPKKMNWHEAMKLNKNGWRVPTIDELGSLTYCSSGKPKGIYPGRLDGGCKGNYRKPTINTTVFIMNKKIMLDLVYWSSSPFAFNNISVWSIYYFSGFDGTSDKSYYGNYVRLVRIGQ